METKPTTFWDFLDKNKVFKIIFMVLTLIIMILIIYLVGFQKYSLGTSIINLTPNKEVTTEKNQIEPKQKIETKIIYRDRFIENKKQPEKEAVKVAPLPNVTVTSYKQTGGITAGGDVNVNTKVDRKLNPADELDVLRMLPNKDEKIVVQSVMNDVEAYQYAKQFFDLLIKNGYKNVRDYIVQIMMSPPGEGLQTGKLNDEFIIRVLTAPTIQQH